MSDKIQRYDLVFDGDYHDSSMEDEEYGDWVKYADVAPLEQQIAEATGYLTRLFHIVAPECKPMDTLLMLCTQIDNYIAGQNRQIAEQAAEIERLEAALRSQKDECERFHKPA